MERRKMIIAGLCLAMMASGAAAAEEGAEAQAVETAAQKLIGKPEEGAFEVTLKNMTGNDITSVKIKGADETEYTQELLEAGDIFAKDEVRTLYFKPSASEEAAGDTTEDGTSAEDGAAAETETAAGEGGSAGKEYDIRLVMTDGSGAEVTKELHAFPFTDAKEAEIALEDTAAFLKYTSLLTGSEVSTKEQEAGRAAEGEKPKKRDWGDAAIVEVVPQTETTSSGSSYDSGSYDDYSYDDYSYDDYSYTDPAQYSCGGDDDNGVNDGLFY